MKTNLFSLFFCLLAVTALSQNREDLATSRIPDYLEKNAQDIVRSEKIIFTVKSIKEGKLSHKKAVTIYSGSSNANLVVVPYDGDTKVVKLKAYLYDAFGHLIRKISNAEINDIAANDGISIAMDNRLKYIKVNHNEYPYTLVYEYEQNLRGAYYSIFPDWNIQDYHSAVQYSSFRVEIPKELQFHYKQLNTNIVPSEIAMGNQKIYHWRVENLPAIKPEPYSPPYTSILPIVMCSPHEFEFEGYKGSMASWEDYGHFMNELYQDRDILPEALLSEVKDLTKNAQTPQEKIQLLYDYLQENTRYVSVQLGIGGWQPFDAAYVYKNKYGDCKALTNYMKALLRAVDIKAYPVLIKSGELSYDVTEDFTTPKFNHVILHAPSEELWLECTSKSYPLNYIGSNNADRNALLITEEGGQLIRTPSLSDNIESNKVIITLAEDGSASLQGSNKTSHERHEWYRWIANESPKQQQEYFVQKSTLPSFDFQHLNINVAPEKPRAEMDYELQVARYASKGGKRLFVPLNAINPFTEIPPEAEDRKYPIQLKSNFIEYDTIQINFPKGFEVESIPEEKFETSSDFATYEIKIEQKEKQLLYTRKLEVTAQTMPADNYEAFRQLFLEVAKKDKMKVVLVKKKT
jgi:transglutaminase-like putative cysteine protease